jgi:hypothetical protein
MVGIEQPQLVRITIMARLSRGAEQHGASRIGISFPAAPLRARDVRGARAVLVRASRPAVRKWCVAAYTRATTPARR